MSVDKYQNKSAMGWFEFVGELAVRVVPRVAVVAIGPVGMAVTGISVGAEVAWLSQNGGKAEQMVAVIRQYAHAVRPALEFLVKNGGSNATIAQELLVIVVDIIEDGNDGLTRPEAFNWFQDRAQRLHDGRNRLDKDDIKAITNRYINDHGRNIFQEQMGILIGQMNDLVPFLRDHSFNLWWRLRW